MDVGPAEDGLPEVDWTPSVRGESPTPRDKKFGPLGGYCADPYVVERRKSRTVTAGPVKFGSDHPIVRQTMLTTLTSDVEGTIEQAIRCADEGFDLVRITVVGMKDAKACVKIREGLDARGYDIPLCADMHFQPKVAIKVAEAVEKIRINPGNFADGRKSFEEIVYETDEDYYKVRPQLRNSAHFCAIIPQLRAIIPTPVLPLLQGPRLLRRGVHAARPGVQEAQPRDADRHQPRLALGAHPLLLRRHAARDGGVGDRVCRHLPRQRLPQLRLLDEGVEPVGDGAGVPPPRRRAVPPRLGLPAPPRRHRGGRGRGRTDEVCDRDRRAPRRRPGRHDPRLAHRGPRARARAVQSARRDRRGADGAGRRAGRRHPEGGPRVRGPPRRVFVLAAGGRAPCAEGGGRAALPRARLPRPPPSRRIGPLRGAPSPPPDAAPLPSPPPRPPRPPAAPPLSSLTTHPLPPLSR